MISKQWILSALLVAIAVVVVGMLAVFPAPTLESSVQGTVDVPAYLEKTVSVRSEGAAPDYGAGVLSFAEDESGEKIRLISVSGTVTQTAGPEIAYVSLSIETLDGSAMKSQSDNAVIANNVSSALAGEGVSLEDIETSSYTLYEEYEWNDTLRKSVSVGYKTVNTIRVKVSDLGNVGNIIDEAVQAGANRVNSVSFALGTESESAIRTLALQRAAENAREKAQSIASGLNVSVGQVYSASESSSYAVPQYARSYAMEDSAVKAGAAPTPVTPGDIEFTATVTVQFEIQ